jgi:hypothetical protein
MCSGRNIPFRQLKVAIWSFSDIFLNLKSRYCFFLVASSLSTLWYNKVWSPFTDRETKCMITGDLRNKTCVVSGGWPLLAIARSKLIHGSWFCTQARYVCVRRAYILLKAGTAYSNTSVIFGSRHTVIPLDTLNTVDCQWCAKVRIFFPLHTLLTTMTSLLAHTVAQPTKWRFLPKNLNQLVIFVIGLAFTWSRVDKNRAQFQKTNYFKKWSYQKMVLL